MQTGLITNQQTDQQQTQAIVSSHGFNYGVKHFFANNKDTLGKTLEITLSIEPNQSEFLLDLGSIYLNGLRVDNKLGLDQVVQSGDLLRVHTTPRRHFHHYNWTERIVFDHPDFLILNKPAGIPSHASVDNAIENALTQTSLALNQNLFISHRLDSLTEGLIVYGKNKKFVQAFNKLLASQQIEKKYVALTERGPLLKADNKNILIHFMKPDQRAPKQVDHVAHEKWLMCELEILEQKSFDPDTWFFKLNLLTGRTHQIRSQLAIEGCPILGDTMYGSKRRLGSDVNPGIALKAQEIRFTYQSQDYLFSLDEDFHAKSD